MHIVVGDADGGAFDSYLAQQGFILVCVDGRGTGGRGAEFEKCTYLKLGDLESKDQVETAIYLGSLPYVDKNRIGVVFGVGIGGIKTFEDEVGYYAQHKENGPKFNPFFIPKMISDIAAGQISIRFGFHGPNYATTSACASSTNALADAFVGIEAFHFASELCLEL